MRFSLFPKEEKFFQMFEDQADLILQTCKRFQELVGDYTEVQAKVDAINRLEGQADDLLHEIAKKLAATFVTPIDREDIHVLAHNMDDIMDFVQGAATRLFFFQVDAPRPRLVELANILVQCAEVLQEAVRRLPRFEDIAELRSQMRDLERQGDRLNRKAIGELFTDVKDVQDLLQLIKWKEIYESSENAVDRFEDAFDVLEGVLIKHA